MYIYREASEKQPPEDEIWFVIIRKKGQHPVYQMRGFLVPRERKGYQSLKTLIVVQGIERYKMLSENSVRISSRRSADKVQDLRCNFLREDCYLMVELGLADCNVTDCELRICLREPNFCSIRPESRQLHGYIRHRRRQRWS